ncbi:defense protein l(2)34Fc-like [Watersipora subatra]|uniref:defense protein l(2)34Fc-like n=1 Tax=Watersipora subatra TaxID=2589382 RepID=UPI00355BA047
MLLAFYLSFLLVCSSSIHALPEGAPESACQPLSPNPRQHEAQRQTSELPYSISCRQLSNNRIRLEIENNGINFRGVLAQIRRGRNIVGQVDQSGAGYQVACNGQAVTQSNGADKRQAVFIFTVGSEDLADSNLECAIAVVQTADVYWADQRIPLTRLNGGIEGNANEPSSMTRRRQGGQRRRGMRMRNRERGERRRRRGQRRRSQSSQ